MAEVSKLPLDQEVPENPDKTDQSERTERSRRLHIRDIADEAPSGPATVGSLLRDARLKRGEDIRLIADHLRIRRDHLEALEEGNHRALPGRTYAIGFLRTYSNYLGLNTAMLLDRFKAEAGEEVVEPVAQQLAFPEASTETRIPRGSLFVLALLAAGAIYGGWMLSISADRMVSERVPPVPERIDESVAADAAPALVGEPDTAGAASAATAPESAPVDPMTIAPVAGLNGIVQADGPAEAPTLAPVEGETAVAALPTATAPVIEGKVYGAENGDGRVVVRALETTWLRVENADGEVLISQTLAAGDAYRAPNKPGLILVARDAGALEVIVDGQSQGAAGPRGLVLTGKSLNPADLLGAVE